MAAVAFDFLLKGKLLWILVATVLGWIMLSQFLDRGTICPGPSTVDSSGQTWMALAGTYGDTSARLGSPEWNSPFNVTEQRVMFCKPGLDLYIHRAFRDDRTPDYSVVRIFGLERLDAVTGNFTCRWSGNDDVTQEVAARKSSVDTSWPQWGYFYACSFDCRVPQTTRPKTIHLVSKDHDCDFKLLIEDTTVSKPQRDLAVCVKPLTGTFNVSRIVEWIEIQRLVGIQHFILYDTDVRGDTRFALDYYSERGLVTLVKFPYLSAVLKKVEPPPLSPQNRYAAYQQIYLVAYQDCLHRFRGTYKFLEIIDIDEVMLPTAEEHWPRMLNRLLELNPASASFLFRTSWHFEESGSADNEAEIPEYLYMQRYATSNEPIHNQPKSVVVTATAVTINYHGVVQVTRPDYRVMIVPWRLFGYVHHYRGTCKGKFQPDRCANIMNRTRVDPVVSRYRERVGRRVKHVLDYLQLTRT